MPWTLGDLKEYIDLILELEPKAINQEVVFEPRDIWKHYHLADGCATRHQFGKPTKIVFRLPE